MIVTEHTDLFPFIGQRVTVDHTRTVRVELIAHGVTDRVKGGAYGMCIEDPHGDCRGGATAFWWPYGTDLEVTA